MECQRVCVRAWYKRAISACMSLAVCAIVNAYNISVCLQMQASLEVRVYAFIGLVQTGYECFVLERLL